VTSNSDIDALVHNLSRDLDHVLRPPAKCQTLSAEDQFKIRAKEEFASELEASGLSGRSAAKHLKVTEGCIRAWLDPRDLKRNPPKWATDALGREAQIRRAQHAVDALKVAGDK
jgi:hypothetical protein